MKRSEQIRKKNSEIHYGLRGFEMHLLNVLQDISETLAMIHDAITEEPEEVKDL